MSEIYERIRILRKDELDLSQQKFGERIGVSRDVIKNMELNLVEVKEHFIKLICSEFNVSEDWLRHGNGDMFIELDREDEITKWLGSLIKPDDDNEFIKKFIHMLSKLNIEDWETLEKMALLIVQENNEGESIDV